MSSATTPDSTVGGNTSDHEESLAPDESKLGGFNAEVDEKAQSPSKVVVAPSAPLTGNNNDPNIVDFEGPDDPYRPVNWPMRKKLITTALYSFTTMGSTWASTIYNSGITQIEAQFDKCLRSSPLRTCFRSIRPEDPVLIPFFMCAIFSFGTATAKDTQTVLITRFFAGIGGSAPLCNTGGVLADIWPPQHRGAALLTYGMAVVAGPLLAPLVGGALVVNLEHDGWRWGEYLTGILLLVIMAADIFYIEESYPPILLTRKANRLRKLTGNWALHSKHQENDQSLKS
uniref:Putative MFS-type transporter n=1 Tax=Talaromyces marneffei PM1 TaxID=1077442 RepID=A0A093W1Q2_TALMA